MFVLKHTSPACSVYSLPGKRGRVQSECDASADPTAPNTQLPRLAVIGAIWPHVGGGGEPIGHVVERRDRGDVPDVAIGEAGAAQPLAVLLFDLPRLRRELDGEVKHRALA